MEQGGDYLLSVKENQGHLYADLEYLFQLESQQDFHQSPFTYAKQVNKNHGRLEIRQCWATSAADYLAYPRESSKWLGLNTLAMIVTERQEGDKTEIKTRYLISSLAAPAKTILKSKRSHWSIENQPHWILEIAFQEDACRVRKDHAPENFAILRHMALNMLKQEKTAKGGVQAKRLQAVGMKSISLRCWPVEMRLPYTHYCPQEDSLYNRRTVESELSCSSAIRAALP